MGSQAAGLSWSLSLFRSSIIRRLLPAAAALVLLSALSACGGGGNTGGSGGSGGSGGGGTNPPPDFTLMVPTGMTVQQGGLPQSFQITDEGSDNNLPIQVTFSGMPSGLTLYGASPYTFAGTAGNSYSWDLSAAPTAASGATTVSISATDGSVTHTYTLGVSVTPSTGFGISLSPSSLSLAPGGTGTVQATITGSNPPANPTVYIQSWPMNLPLDQAQIQSTGPETFNITFQAPLGLTAQASIPLFVVAYTQSDTSDAAAPLTVNLTQPFPPITAPTRSNIVRTGDSPEAAVYDQARKLVFVAYGNLNQVVAYSSVDQHVVATIPVPQYQLVNQSGGVIDESADGTRLYVAGPEKITILNPDKLQVIGTQLLPYAAPATSPSLGPVKLAALADGNVLILNYDNHVYLWNSQTGSVSLNDPPAPVSVTFGDTLTRSADHSTALLYAPGNYAALLHSGNDAWGASLNMTELWNRPMAVSPNGSQIATVCLSGNLSTAVTEYDANFQQTASTAPPSDNCFWSTGNYGAIYSLDGTRLYAFLGPGYYGAAYDAQTLNPLGLFTAGDAIAIAHPLAIDETGLVYGSGFGIGVGGLVVSDVSDPGALGPDPNYADGSGSFPLPYPTVQFPIADLKPSPAPGQASAQEILGAGFDPANTYSVYVGPPPATSGATPATGLTVTTNAISFTAPALTTPGPANITLTRSDGWNAVLPDAISYGPSLLGVDPSAIPPSQTTTEQLYGFNSSLGTVTVGGSSATTSQATVLNPSNLFYPIENTTMATSSGTPGWADLVYSNLTGTATLHHAMQFLQSAQHIPISGATAGLVYDQAHQRVYVANTSANNVAVFDLGTSALLSPIAVGNGPTSLALTPDDSTLAVLNAADETVSIVNTAQMTVTATVPAVTATEKSANLVAPASIAPFGSHQILILLNGGPYAHVLDLTSGSLSCAGITGCDSTGVALQLGFWPSAAASTPDGSQVLIAALGNMALLNTAQNTLTSGYSMMIQGNAAAIDADANVLAQNLGIYDASLHPVVSLGGQEFWYTGGLPALQPSTSVEALNASGSLLFTQVGSEIYAYDVRHGNVALRIAIPEPEPSVKSIALDETGTKVFLTTVSALDILQLYEAPLSIASVTPASGAVGTTVTMRGSGFENGTTVTFGTEPAAVEYVDAMTLHATVPTLSSGPLQITVTNPDGSTYSLDDAFTLQ